MTQLVSTVERCHWVATMADTVPMTNRSYASVKNPTPDTTTVRRWNLLLGASSNRWPTEGGAAPVAPSAGPVLLVVIATHCGPSMWTEGNPQANVV